MSSPIILPSNVANTLSAVRESTLLGPHTWKIAWRNADPRRIVVIHKTEPKPYWAELEWEPDYPPFGEHAAIRAVLRTFVSEGWEVEQVDDAFGEAVRTWAHDAQRVMRGMGKNQAITAYQAVRSHLVNGGLLRTIPLNVVKLVAEYYGLSRFRHWLQSEYEEYGAFPKPLDELVGDCWRTSGDDDTLRIDTSPHLERRGEVPT